MVKVETSTTMRMGADALANKAGSVNSGSASNFASSFASVIKDTSIKAFNGSMQELISIVQANGAKFIKNPDEDNLNSYKNSIKQYLERFKKEFISLKEEFGTKQNGEQKIYQLLNTIEEDVASVTRETLTNSKATELLSSLDDIRGLVIDILG